MIRYAKLSFWTAVALFFLGTLICFAPGAEVGWFAVCAVLAIPGALIRNRPYTIAAVGLFLICSAAAVSDYCGHGHTRARDPRIQEILMSH